MAFLISDVVKWEPGSEELLQYIREMQTLIRCAKKGGAQDKDLKFAEEALQMFREVFDSEYGLSDALSAKVVDLKNVRALKNGNPEEDFPF